MTASQSQRNIEIKARLRDRETALAVLDELGAGHHQTLIQHDTFFPCPNGRLKLRLHDDGTGELIHYDRPDTAEAKISRYRVVETGDPSNLVDLLTAALGIAGVVAKTRQVYVVGHTRIHIDQVDGVGDFLELEVVLEPGQTEEHGHEIVRGLMRKLDIRTEDLVVCAYVDLLGPVA
jgi:predicted adenylyl cyclase CyaB